MHTFEQFLEDLQGQSALAPDALSIAQMADPNRCLHQGQQMHCFLYTPQGRLYVDPETNRGHYEWANDSEVEEGFPKDFEHEVFYMDGIMGRFGVFQGLPVVSIWFAPNSKGQHLLKPALQALTAHAPKDSIVTGGKNSPLAPFPLSSLIRPARNPSIPGLKWWAPTSESYRP